jgi:putative transcriptional regulator
MLPVNLTNHFLIAMPGMVDPYFSKTLTFVCEHNDKGALGVVVNKPIDVTLGNLFEQVEIPLDDEVLSTQSLYFGGPVQVDRGFVLHEPQGVWSSSLKVGPSIALTTSRDILEAMAKGKGPSRQLITLGYSGWSAGQLEEEIKRNGWLTVEADPETIFGLSAESRLEAAMAKLGLNFGNLSDQAGHA